MESGKGIPVLALGCKFEIKVIITGFFVSSFHGGERGGPSCVN